MNYLMFHQSGEGQSPKVPDGLKELMTDISREVLREQPENIYEFVADYLEEMEITREHKGIAENLLDMVIDESVTVYEMFKESGISLEHAEKSAKIIESSFNEYAKNKKAKSGDQQPSSKAMEKILKRDVCRKIMQSCDLTREQDQKLRKIVQMCFKSFYFREKSYKLKLTRLPDSHWANRAEKTLDIYRRSAPDKSKLDRAAVVIQSAYRSYFVRKMPKEIQRFHECATKIQTRFRGHMAQKRLQKAKAAAIKIQAMYRGYRTRKFLLNQREMEKMKNQPFSLVMELVDDIVTSCTDPKKKKSKDSHNTSNSYYEHQSDSNQSVRSAAIDSDNSGKRNNSNNSNSIQTEIRTDDFVLVVKKSEPSKVILNGRAALCAGRDDMSSEDEERSQNEHHQLHRFNKPDNFKTVLESGAIPDAAMIHAARKRRQKAREQGDFIPIEDKPPDNRKGRLVREGDDDLDEDEERVDMSAINGAKEREERREKFYSVQQEYSGDDSDTEINEWENQQIRKGVTGAQLVSAQQESAIYSQYLIKPAADSCNDVHLSTSPSQSKKKFH